MTQAPGAFANRAYQMTSTEKVLPTLIRCAVGETEITTDFRDCTNGSELYLSLKAVVDLLGECFDTLDEIDEALEPNDYAGFSLASDHPAVVQQFGELHDGEHVDVEDWLYPFFYESVAQEFADHPRQYARYSLDQVAAIEAPFYWLKASPQGVFFSRESPVIAEEPRVEANLNVVRVEEQDPSPTLERSPWEPLEEADGSEY